jgi:hypothetical protein
VSEICLHAMYTCMQVNDSELLGGLAEGHIAYSRYLERLYTCLYMYMHIAEFNHTAMPKSHVVQ